MYSYNTAEVKFKSKISSVEIYNYTIITPLACFAPGKHLWKKNHFNLFGKFTPHSCHISIRCHKQQQWLTSVQFIGFPYLTVYARGKKHPHASVFLQFQTTKILITVRMCEQQILWLSVTLVMFHMPHFSDKSVQKCRLHNQNRFNCCNLGGEENSWLSKQRCDLITNLMIVSGSERWPCGNIFQRNLSQRPIRS